jgi:hypothetical protein
MSTMILASGTHTVCERNINAGRREHVPFHSTGYKIEQKARKEIVKRQFPEMPEGDSKLVQLSI